MELKHLSSHGWAFAMLGGEARQSDSLSTFISLCHKHLSVSAFLVCEFVGGMSINI